jgi:hypothetical protein
MDMLNPNTGRRPHLLRQLLGCLPIAANSLSLYNANYPGFNNWKMARWWAWENNLSWYSATAVNHRPQAIQLSR